MWFEFNDMHSGGGQKLDWAKIYIEASSEEDAIEIFEAEFGRNPQDSSCDTCGDDYSISEHESLKEATAYSRNCRYETTKNGGGRYVEEGDEKYGRKFIPFSTFLNNYKLDGILGVQECLVIEKKVIKKS